MNVSKYILLLQKKLRRDLSEQEKTELRQWSEKPDNAAMAKDLERIWEWSAQYKNGYQPDVEAGLSRFKTRIGADHSVIRRNSGSRNFLRLAAALLLLLAMAWVWRSYLSPANAEIIAQTNIDERKTVELPDGSTVVLNQNSTLIYSGRFNSQSKREVQLEGEAYFDIRSNPERPFVIYTPEADIEVLGTTFNVRAYVEEAFTEVNVESGKVAFNSRDKAFNTVLNPMEKAVYRHEGKMIEGEDELLNAHSWRTRQLRFRNTPLIDVLEALERHFNVDFDTASADLSKCNYTSNFEEEQLDNILEAMAISFGFSFTSTDDAIY